MLSLIKVKDIDGVILGCTELHLIITQYMTTIPLLNTVEIQVEAILDLALKEGEHALKSFI
ncbi:MAG: hypothetical protein ACTSU4_15075 [Promethearchaeota archaeon]